jgi:hypothetical protein
MGNFRWCDDVPWETFHDLFARSYWLRAWIVQEVANNHNATLFIYGEKKLTRDMLMNAVDFYQSHIDALEDRISSKTKQRRVQGSDVWTKIARAGTLLWLRNSLTQKPACSTVLDLARQAHTTDSRDKVYGFLGLLDDNITSRITPDYDLTVLDVYTEFAIALVNVSQNLNVIFTWCNSKLEDDWPSWVPDWREPFNRKHMQWLLGREASRNSNCFASFSSQKQKLPVRGSKIDTI